MLDKRKCVSSNISDSQVNSKRGYKSSNDGGLFYEEWKQDIDCVIYLF